MDSEYQMPPDHEYFKIRDDYVVGQSEEEIFAWLQEVIPNIKRIGDYKPDDTPYDQFDSHCHKVGSGIATLASKGENDDEDELIFLINLAEHVKRPEDMLMFLGEYFKYSQLETEKVHENTSGNNDNNRGKKKQDKFFLTPDIINYLGTACKMYIEDLRQELRISIALYRNPTFHDNLKQKTALAKNIVESQILIIKRCIQIYKFIDYFHDKRHIVPLKYITQQPPPYILNAFFLKMKADYLRYIYECLSGDNGLLGSYKETKMSFNEILKDVNENEIKNDEAQEVVDCEIYYTLYPISGQSQGFKSSKEKLQDYYKQEITMLDYLEHEIAFEYEKVKDQIFDNNKKPKQQTKQDYVIEHDYAEFHPVFLSSLLNQTVFLGDVQDQKYKDDLQKSNERAKRQQQEKEMQIPDKAPEKESGDTDATIYRRKKDNLQKLYNYVLRWTDEIDNVSYIMTISNKENQETARSIQNLLERALDNWKDPK